MAKYIVKSKKKYDKIEANMQIVPGDKSAYWAIKYVKVLSRLRISIVINIILFGVIACQIIQTSS